MTIGLICAIPQELAHLRGALADSHSEEAAHTVFDTGTIDGHDVVLAGSGMGKVNAALVTTLLADRFGCRTVVFSGVAGFCSGAFCGTHAVTSIFPWRCHNREIPSGGNRRTLTTTASGPSSSWIRVSAESASLARKATSFTAYSTRLGMTAAF